MAIGLAVVGAIGVLVGGLYLALQRVPAAPPRTQQIGSVRVTVGTEPRVPWTGPAELVVSIVDAGGTPVTDAAVTLTYDMETDSIGRRMAGMGEPGRAAARMDSPGRYSAPVSFRMAGQWMVRVAIDRGGRQEGQGEFLVTVR
ncbi:MAG: FixH family protein [candidate division NC10 bacterium]|nr:FixH family protein [candidate division NC10 bacterium]